MTRAVLLHGWGMSAGVWSELHARLHRDVCTPDLPGYRAANVLAPYTLDAVVDRLARDADETVDVVGWSLGALIAMHWAAVRPRQVRRLVLLGATPRFVATDDWAHGVTPAMLRIFNAELKRAPDALMRRFCALQAQGEAEADERAAMLYALRGHASAQTLCDSLALLGGSDLRGELSTFAQPTLILHGQRDAIIPVDAARWMATRMPHPQLRIFDDCGHALPVFRAAACAQWIERFLDE